MQITQQARDIAVEACEVVGFELEYRNRIQQGKYDSQEEVIAAQMALNASARAPMTEDEIIERAGCAYKTVADRHFVSIKTIVEAAVAQALRDLDKPLVDPVVLACREILAKRSEEKGFPRDAQRYRSGDDDHFQTMECAVAAYRAGMQHNG